MSVRLALAKYMPWLRNILLMLFAVSPAFMIFPESLSNTESAFRLFTVTAASYISFLCIIYIAEVSKLIEARIAALTIMATCYCTWYIIGFYRLYSGTIIRIEILTENYDIALQTISKVFGLHIIILSLGLIMSGWMACFFMSKRSGLQVQKVRRLIAGRRNTFALLLLACVFVGTTFHKGMFDIANANVIEPHNLPAYMPVLPELPTDSEDSIFYLQLESGNAAVITQPAEIDGRSYTGTYNPSITEISKDGVYFPQFWGNSTFTVRAWENILCSITGNIRISFAQRLDALTGKCLPEIFKDAGYTTIFIKNHDLSFRGAEHFAKKIGFLETHNKDLVPPDTKIYDWGYDDCSMYRGIFKYLREKYPDGRKLFVYIAVSSHHTPFTPKEDYAYTHAFPNPSHPVEQYLNSYLEQDECTKVFYEEYKAYRNEKTHLFISPDHAVPMKNSSGKELFPSTIAREQFLIHWTYIPSEERKEEFRVGEHITTRFSETDIAPTILSILSRTPVPQSFDQALRKDAEPIDPNSRCAILINPYSGLIITAVHGEKLIVFNTLLSRMSVFDLTLDPLGHTPVMSFVTTIKEFQRQYYCDYLAHQQIIP